MWKIISSLAWKLLSIHHTHYMLFRRIVVFSVMENYMCYRKFKSQVHFENME